jgi:hypothetical protein
VNLRLKRADENCVTGDHASNDDVPLGLLFLGGYVVLGKLYWFRVPFRGIVIATVCYIAGLVVAWA